MIESDPKKRLLALHAAKEVSLLIQLTAPTIVNNDRIRSSPIAPKDNWKVSLICSGAHCSSIRKTLKNLLGMWQLPASENSLRLSLRVTCRSYMFVFCPIFFLVFYVLTVMRPLGSYHRR